MTGWLILSERDAPLAEQPARLDKGALVMEFAWPLPSGVLLDWRAQDGSGQALSLFHHPQAGLSLYWRDGARLVRHVLPGPLRADQARVAQLTFRWDGPGGQWRLRLDGGDGSEIAATFGLSPAVPMLAALAEMAAGRGIAKRDGILWFGVLAGDEPPARAPWIGRNTPVPTPSGPVAAGNLRAGDWILTEDAGPLRLRDIRPLHMPSRGSHAAVILRAPYFAEGADILVSADQMVAVGGPEAEYLFGEERVLVSAGALADGRSALTDNRRAMTTGVSLDLGSLHVVDCGGCPLLTAHHGPAALAPLLPLRALRDYEAPPLMALLRRMRPSAAA